MHPPAALFTMAGCGIGAAAARKSAVKGWAGAILSTGQNLRSDGGLTRSV